MKKILKGIKKHSIILVLFIWLLALTIIIIRKFVDFSPILYDANSLDRSLAVLGVLITVFTILAFMNMFLSKQEFKELESELKSDFQSLIIKLSSELNGLKELNKKIREEYKSLEKAQLNTTKYIMSYVELLSYEDMFPNDSLIDDFERYISEDIYPLESLYAVNKILKKDLHSSISQEEYISHEIEDIKFDNKGHYKNDKEKNESLYNMDKHLTAHRIRKFHILYRTIENQVKMKEHMGANVSICKEISGGNFEVFSEIRKTLLDDEGSSLANQIEDKLIFNMINNLTDLSEIYYEIFNVEEILTDSLNLYLDNDIYVILELLELIADLKVKYGILGFKKYINLNLKIRGKRVELYSLGNYEPFGSLIFEEKEIGRIKNKYKML